MICSISECGKSIAHRGLCNGHYLKLLRYGDPLHQIRRAPAKTPEEKAQRVKEWKHQNYLRARDRYLARARAAHADGRYNEARQKYFLRDDIKQKARDRTRNWVKANPDRKRAMDKAFNEANPALVRSYKAKRRAAERKAAPPWLTETHRAEMAAKYQEAEQLTLATGTEHEVDHILPLQAGCACGLHVPWNLRVLTRDENNRRPRKWTPEALTLLHKSI